ncbi:IctB family putative bicarbonate transporter [Crocosphaera sp. XPORK-15E]|uniref:IctB family putative bicarbonate transporter n=1 Tax=Crocosphaera sp. XPORK-15E TaxID=3110247 RepID=UPI002B1FE47F|nr:IctB family putative bicarbonate transporter [Crocosphaera sp. XPORK-15E]MEA5534028.1 IctB family putative bicarbonate transporter [Crocosphaera sp. XPORK-15E]
MNSTWDQITLSYFSAKTWLNASYVYRIVGLFSQWRQGSFLLQWGEAIGALLLSIVFLFSPFVTTGLIGVWLAAITAYWVLLTVSDTQKPGLTPIHLLVFVYWGISAVAVAFSPVKAAAFAGFIKLTLYLIFFAFSARILRSPRLTNWLISVILGIGLLVSSYGVRQQIFGVEQLATWNDPTSEFANATRVYSYLENPNLLSSYILPAIAFSISALFVWKGLLPKVLAATMVMVNIACLYFTGSRGGWIAIMALFVAFFLLFFVWFKNNLSPFWRKWLLPVVFGSLGGLLFVAIISVDPLRGRVMSIFAGRQDSSNNFRMNVWMAVIEMIRDRPLIGIGPGNSAFNKIYPLYMSPKYSALSSYSVLLETAVETGFIGLSIFVWLIVVTVNQGVQQIQRLRDTNNPHAFWIIAAIAAMAGLLAQGMFDTVWYRPQVNTLWWFLVALIASQYQPKSKDNVVDTIDETEFLTVNH